MNAAGNVEDLIASLTGFGGAASTAAQSAENTAAGMNDLQRATNSTSKSQKELTEVNKKAKETILDLYDAIKELEEGATKYKNTISVGADGIVSAVATFGSVATGLITRSVALSTMVGSAIKGLGSVYTDFAKDSLKQHDLLVKSYQSLSQFGAIDSSGLRGLLTTIEDIGSSPENVQFFIDTISKASEQLVMFGGTVNGGAVGVANTVKNLTDRNEAFEAQLNQMGITTQDFSKYVTGFVSTVSRSTRLNVSDTEALRKQSFDYMVTLQELAELTGISRDKQQEEIEAQQKDLQFRMYLRKLGQEEDGANKVIRANQLIGAIENKAAQQAMKESLATGGSIVSATGAMQADIIRQSYGTAKDVINGTKRITDGIVEINKDIGVKTFKRLDANAAGIAFGTKEYADSIGANANQLDAAQKAAAMNLDKTKTNTAAALSLQDANLKAETERRQNERIVSNYYQELYKAVGNYAVPAATALAEAAVLAAKALSNTIGRLPVLSDVNKRGIFAGFDLNKARTDIESPHTEAPPGPTYDQAGNVVTGESDNRVRENLRANIEDSKKLLELNKTIGNLERDLADKKASDARKLLDQANRLSPSPSSNMTATSLNRSTENLDRAVKEFSKIDPSARVTSTTGGRHTPGSAHYEGRAYDVAFGPSGSGKVLSPEQINNLKKQLSDAGIPVTVSNEMVRPKKGKPGYEEWTGPH